MNQSPNPVDEWLSHFCHFLSFSFLFLLPSSSLPLPPVVRHNSTSFLTMTTATDFTFDKLIKDSENEQPKCFKFRAVTDQGILEQRTSVVSVEGVPFVMWATFRESDLVLVDLAIERGDTYIHLYQLGDRIWTHEDKKELQQIEIDVDSSKMERADPKILFCREKHVIRHLQNVPVPLIFIYLSPHTDLLHSTWTHKTFRLQDIHTVDRQNPGKSIHLFNVDDPQQPSFEKFCKPLDHPSYNIDSYGVDYHENRTYNAETAKWVLYELVGVTCTSMEKVVDSESSLAVGMDKAKQIFVRAFGDSIFKEIETAAGEHKKRQFTVVFDKMCRGEHNKDLPDITRWLVLLGVVAYTPVGPQQSEQAHD